MRKYFILLIGISGLLLACGGQTIIHPIDKFLSDKIKVNDNNVPIDSNQYYFPFKEISETSTYIGLDTFVNNWFSSQLFAMKEPLLFNKRIEKEIYRFTWLRTFHNPIAIRIEKEGETYKVYWKECDGAGGYSPGKLIIDKQKEIEKEQWDEFQNLLTRTKYWNMVTNENIFGEDGSEWILEGVNSKSYHVVVRWTPGSGDYFNCCNYLINLIDLKINKVDKY